VGRIRQIFLIHVDWNFGVEPNPQRRSVECGADRRVSRKNLLHAQLVLFLVENHQERYPVDGGGRHAVGWAKLY